MVALAAVPPTLPTRAGIGADLGGDRARCWLLGYTYRFELRDVGDRVLAELIPGPAATRGRTVEIARGAGGSFSVTIAVNGARVAMVLDTGATAVVLTQEAAKAAGLPLEVLNYSVNVETANGRARAAPVTLDRVSVGGITERSVPALDCATRAIAHQPARHELPQPAGKLGGARRQADDARLSVSAGNDGPALCSEPALSMMCNTCTLSGSSIRNLASRSR